MPLKIETVGIRLSGRLIPLTPEAIADSVEELLTHPEQIRRFEQASRQIDLAHSEDFPAFYELLSDT